MDKLILSGSPHIRSNNSTRRVMGDVIIALLPATFAGVWFFGPGVLWTIALCIISSVGCEALMQYIMKREITIDDLSAVLTGLLLALNLPPESPWYLSVCGSAFAIIVAKQLFGGLGYNFMNPALAGRCFLLISWPVAMTAWVYPGIVESGAPYAAYATDALTAASADALTTATPLARLAMGSEFLPTISDLFLGSVAGCIGETSALALLIGAAYLFIRKVISWQIPVAYLGTVAVFALFTGDPTLVAYHLFAGGVMLGAFFMATDYVSSPVGSTAKIVFGIGCGILTMVIRQWGGYPEGVSFSILFMNLWAPLLDRTFVPKIYGEVKKLKKNESTATLCIRLLIITACAGLILGLVYMLTKGPIEQQTLKRENESRQGVLPDADDFICLMNLDENGARQKTQDAPPAFPDDTAVYPEITQVYVGTAGGNPVGYTMAIVTKGFSPNLNLTVGMDTNGVITGVDIGSHEETPGLGANATNPDFLAQYVGADGPVAVVKTPTGQKTDIVALTGATITSNAVTNAINMAREFYDEYLAQGVNAADVRQPAVVIVDATGKQTGNWYVVKDAAVSLGIVEGAGN